MHWCFAIINNKLAEIFYEKKGRGVHFMGHAYVQKEEYKTKREQEMIIQDTLLHRFLYQKGKYKRISI